MVMWRVSNGDLLPTSQGGLVSAKHIFKDVWIRKQEQGDGK